MSTYESIVIAKGQAWPEGISDGLNIACPYCHLIPHLDYRVTEKAWRRVVPDQYRLGVVCLECFIDQGGLPSDIVFIQVIGYGQTAVLTTDRIYRYAERYAKS